MYDLEPCPWCKNPVRISDLFEGYGQRPSMNYPCIRCDTCDLVTTFGARATHKMVERWNSIKSNQVKEHQ